SEARYGPAERPQQAVERAELGLVALERHRAIEIQLGPALPARRNRHESGRHRVVPRTLADGPAMTELELRPARRDEAVAPEPGRVRDRRAHRAGDAVGPADGRARLNDHR